MITSISLYQFKNHLSFSTTLSDRVICTGRNGAGKSNLLSALYLGINGILPRGATLDSLFPQSATQGQVRLVIPTHVGDAEYTVSFDRETRALRLLYQGEKETRGAYLARHQLRAVLFDPIEMNLLYLGPSLRRDFLDEILLIAHPEFLSIRRKYYQILRSRNALLKSISKGESPESDLATWDLLLADSIILYEAYREKIIAHFRTHLQDFESSICF